jgi:hypothetical protein
MKRSLITVAITAALTVGAFAGLPMKFTQALFVAGTPNNAKALEEMLDDRDAKGISAQIDDGAFGIIPAGSEVFLGEIKDGVAVIRFNGEDDYAPMAELMRVTNNKLGDMIKQSAAGK